MPLLGFVVCVQALERLWAGTETTLVLLSARATIAQLQSKSKRRLDLCLDLDLIPIDLYGSIVSTLHGSSFDGCVKQRSAPVTYTPSRSCVAPGGAWRP